MREAPNVTTATDPRAARGARIVAIVEITTIVTFVALSLAPTVDWAVRPDEARSPVRENRTAAPPPVPVTDLDSLTRQAPQFEAWFGDRMGLRDVLLRGSQALRYFVFGTEPSPTLVPGKDGWLFFGADDSIAVHRGLRPLTHAELVQWKTTLEAERDWCRNVGAEFVFAIGPNKQSVYPEKWPDELSVVGPTRLDQLVEYLRRESDVHFVDLRGALAAERAHDRPEMGDYTFHPLGSHWTYRGAWAGWNGIVDALPAGWAQRLLRPRDAFVAVERADGRADSMGEQTYVGDLLSQRDWDWNALDDRDVTFRYDARGQVIGSRREGVERPTVLIVHDSFGPWLLRQVAPCFSRMDAVWAHSFPKETVEELAPNLVVQLYTERLLVWGLPPMSPDVARVSAGEFEGYPLGAGALDLASEASIGVEGGVSLARFVGALAVDQRLENGVLSLPACEVPEGSELALHVDVTAPTHTRMTVFFQLRKEPTFSRRRAVSLVLEPGRNDLHFRVRVPGVNGPIKVRLGAEPGRYVLHAVEARAAPPR